MKNRLFQNLCLTLVLFSVGSTCVYSQKHILKGLNQARTLGSFEKQVEFLRNQNPTVSIKTITSLVRQLKMTSVSPIQPLDAIKLKTESPDFPTRPLVSLSSVLQNNDLEQLQSLTVGDLSFSSHAITGSQQFGPLRTSLDLLKKTMPHWREQLSKLYTSEQVNLINMALIVSDYDLMSYHPQGGFVLRGSEWDFADKFSHILQQIAPHQFSSEQIDRLVTKNLAPGFSLKSLFRLRSLQNFVTLYNRVPRSSYPRNNETTRPEAQLASSILATVKKPNSTKISALDEHIRSLYAIYQRHYGNYSPSSLLIAVEEFMQTEHRFPRMRIVGKETVDYTTEEIFETHLRQSIENILHRKADQFSQNIAFQQIQALKKAHVSKKNSLEDLLAQTQQLVNQNGVFPRRNIPNKIPSQYTDAEKQEVHLSRHLKNVLSGSHNVEHPVLKQLHFLQLRYHTKSVEFHKIAQEAYDDFIEYVANYQTIPPVQSKIYYRAYTHLYHPAYIFYGTPDTSSPLFKLNDLFTKIRAVKKGELPITAIAPANPNTSLSKSYVPDNGLVLWTKTHQNLLNPTYSIDDPLDFENWFARNQHAMVSTQNTKSAFNALRLSVRNGTPDDETYRILDHLYSQQVGYRPDGCFVGIVYRGNTPTLPLAKDFHFVEEYIHGIPKEQVPEAESLANNLNHVWLLIDDYDTITSIGLNNQVNANDIATLFDALTPEGYMIRMSPHEFSIIDDLPTKNTFSGELHLHIEKIQPTGKGEPDINYIIRLDTLDLIQGKNPYQIFKIYRDLFSPYMDDYMKQYTLPQGNGQIMP